MITGLKNQRLEEAKLHIFQNNHAMLLSWHSGSILLGAGLEELHGSKDLLYCIWKKY